MKTIGQKIRESRGRSHVSGEALGAALGLSKGTVSRIENDDLKGGPDPELIIKIAEILGDDSILLHYLEKNPVYRAILPKIFPDLNNIRRDPAVIFTRLAREAEEAMNAAMIMAEVFSNAEPRMTPNFEAVFAAKMEQIIDIKRAAEILEFELLASGVITKEWLHGVYEQQQAKCVERGHHRLVPDRRQDDRRHSDGRRAENGGH